MNQTCWGPHSLTSFAHVFWPPWVFPDLLSAPELIFRRKKYARCGYTNVTFHYVAKAALKHQTTFWSFSKQFFFDIYLFPFLPYHIHKGADIGLPPAQSPTNAADARWWNPAPRVAAAANANAPVPTKSR